MLLESLFNVYPVKKRVYPVINQSWNSLNREKVTKVIR